PLIICSTTLRALLRLSLAFAAAILMIAGTLTSLGKSHAPKVAVAALTRLFQRVVAATRLVPLRELLPALARRAEMFVLTEVLAAARNLAISVLAVVAKLANRVCGVEGALVAKLTLRSSITELAPVTANTAL